MEICVYNGYLSRSRSRPLHFLNRVPMVSYLLPTHRESRNGLHQVRCKYLHLTALGDDHVHIRYILATVASLCSFHLLDYVHTLEYLAKDNVLVVEEGCGNCGDKELGSVGVWSSVLTLVSTISPVEE